MAVTGVSRWKKLAAAKNFWDLRPFSRVVVGFKAMLMLAQYVQINQLEAQGVSRSDAQFYINWQTGPPLSKRD